MCISASARRVGALQTPHPNSSKLGFRVPTPQTPLQGGSPDFSSSSPALHSSSRRFSQRFQLMCGDLEFLYFDTKSRATDRGSGGLGWPLRVDLAKCSKKLMISDDVRRLAADCKERCAEPCEALKLERLWRCLKGQPLRGLGGPWVSE